MKNALFTLVFYFVFQAVGFAQNITRLAGVATRGGVNNSGILYSLQPDGEGFNVDFSFEKAGVQYPYAAVLKASDGLLYGCLGAGGDFNYGAIYQVEQDGFGFILLHHFEGIDGTSPNGALLEASDGRLYGMATGGGLLNLGVIYSLQKDGSDFKVLHHFSDGDGKYPRGSLVEVADGYLYGLTPSGGDDDGGVLFRIKKNGDDFSVLYSFIKMIDGYNAYGVPVEDGEGNFMILLADGGPDFAGSILRISLDGSSHSVLHSFNYNFGGANPLGSLIKGSDGRFYGTTAGGGDNFQGTVFSIDAQGTGIFYLRHFSGDDGFLPLLGNALLEHPAGQLYGVTFLGGQSGFGTIFKVETDGDNFSVIHHFDLPTGSYPWTGLVPLDNGKLAGTASQDGPGGGGVIYSIFPDGSDFTTLHSFSTSNPTGYLPNTSVIVGSDDRLYGVTQNGGEYGKGVIYSTDKTGSDFKIVRELDGITSGYGRLLEASDGKLYVASPSSGDSNNGLIYRLNKDGSGFEVLHLFDEFASFPIDYLVEGSDGKLYGAVMSGGKFFAGAIYRLDKDGSGFQLIFSLEYEITGSGIGGTILEASDGRIYAVTNYGGPSDEGMMFRIDKNGNGFEIVTLFDVTNGALASDALIEGSDGFIYGVNAVYDVVYYNILYRVEKSGSDFEILHQFDPETDGEPTGNLLQHPTEDIFYGITRDGGANDKGSVFSIRTDGSEFTRLYDFEGFPGSGQFPAGGLAWVEYPNTLSERKPALDLLLSPNPTAGRIHLQWLDNQSLLDQIELVVSDENGKPVFQSTGLIWTLNQQLQQAAAQWGNGLYFFQGKTAKGLFSEKLVLQR